MNDYLKVTKTNPSAILPKRATDGSAGYDLFVCIEEPMIINPGESYIFPTGIAIEIDDPMYVGLVFARSGLSIKHGITLSNAVGVIDSDYRGEIAVSLYNTSLVPYKVEPFERVAQLVIMPIITPKILEVDTLNDTSRGSGGFGSTGK